MDNIIQLRAVDRKRLDHLQDRTESPLVREDIWYIHTVLARCFLPCRDPKTRDWTRKNGNYSIFLTAGLINGPRSPSNLQIVGLPYGAKPHLFQSYVCTQVIKQQSPVVSVERSMTAMMHELGLKVTGGKEGTIRAFKDQITRFARCNFTFVRPGDTSVLDEIAVERRTRRGVQRQQAAFLKFRVSDEQAVDRHIREMRGQGFRHTHTSDGE
jgi:hypothetical protein